MDNDSIDFEEMQLDEEINDYLTVALANGFSKGTANVSPRDMTKLKGLLKHYAKKKHPFTACVTDNTKRFGPEKAKAVCAVLKDLIRGTTKWRSTERKKNLSEENFILKYDDDNYITEFIDWAINLDEETVNIILNSNNEDSEVTELELEAGDVAWQSMGSYSDIRRQIEAELNDGSDGYGSSYWVDDLKNSEALVCAGGRDYFVVPFSVSKKGTVELDDEEAWKPVERAWVETNMTFSEDNQELLAELYFTESGGEADTDGLVWKTFLREGTWKFSPGNGKLAPKTLSIVSKGKSDARKNIISMADLKKNFDLGTIQHVTVPLNHDDKVHENTGFVKKLRYGKDEKGRRTLEAAIDFTEPDIKEKIERGTIPNVSGGIHLNYINKESGKKFDAVLGHLALTPKPFIQGMKPFGVKASENLNVLGFSEVIESADKDPEGGAEEIMSTEIEHVNESETFLSELGLSEDEVKARLSRYDELEQENKLNKVTQKVKDWEEAKKAPAIIAVAEAALLADEGLSTINLSEDGKSVEIGLSDLVDRLVDASPSVTLADDPISDGDVEGEAPEDDATEENLSAEVQAEANRLFLYERMSEDEALAEAKRRFKEESTE